MTRFAALFIALAVAAAPVALETCEIRCASGPMHPGAMTTGADAHVMHHHGSAASTGVSAPCDHGGDVISPSVVTARTDTGASAPARSVASDLPEMVRAASGDRGWSLSLVARLGLRLSVPLRI